MSSTTGNTVENENYPTPEAAVRALLKAISFKPGDSFLEPCCGDLMDEKGTPLPCIFNLVPLMPVAQKDWAEIRLGREFLGRSYEGQQFDVIITNPPFTLSEAFLRKCLDLLAPGGTLIFLQRVNWLGSKKRVKFWREVGMPKKAAILVPRPKFDKSKKGTDSCEYAWMVIRDGGNRVNMPDGFSHSIAEGYKID